MKNNKYRVGRVHWFLWHLDPIIKLSYRIVYNYAYHRYMLYRGCIVRPYEVFTVVRTSKRCFRVTYGNFFTSEIVYKSFSTSKACCKWIKSVYDSHTSFDSPP